MPKFTELTKSNGGLKVGGLGGEEGRQRGALDKLFSTEVFKPQGSLTLAKYKRLNSEEG